MEMLQVEHLSDQMEIKTLGIMMPGEYTFGTNEAELMEIIAGEVS